MPEPQQSPTAASPERELALLLTKALVQAHGVNDFLSRFLKAIGEIFCVSRLALFDYDDSADYFDLLYWRGYRLGSRSELRRRLYTMGIRRALAQQEPFWSDESRQQLLIPLYFRETLEAVLVLECADRPFELDDSSRAACKLISRFLGLFMSSSRLPVNVRNSALTMTDLERAREVQLSYLPSEHPVTERYEIYGYNQSSALVGGDYFDYFRQRENSVQCVVADACGHGLAAALIMSTFRGLLQSDVQRAEDFSELFTRINRQLYNEGEVLQYLTVVFFDYDEKTGQLQYFNAGHFDPLIVRPSGASSPLSGGGPPLGMFQNSSYALQSCRMEVGDLLLLFTDGLVELRDAQDQFFGVDGILEAVVARRTLRLKDLARDVLAKAAKFSSKPQPDDDLTLFLMRFR